MQRIHHDSALGRIGVALMRAAGVALLCAVVSGCSISKFAANRAGSALAGSGTVFAADDDPELIRDAAPFSLKLMESLLSSSPENKDLLLAACSGFTQYAYAFVEQEADEVAATDFGAAKPKYIRARRMYLRARDYGVRGLAAGRKGFREALAQDPKRALAHTAVKDVPLLYWTAASWGKAIGLSKDNPDLLADISTVEALIDRALALDEGYDHGAIHGMLISYEMIRARGVGEAKDRAKLHFDRAVVLSEGRSASPYVSLAEATCLPAQDRAGFESLLKKALEIDPDKYPDQRLMNLVLQKRARWLLSRVDELFLEPASSDRNEK